MCNFLLFKFAFQEVAAYKAKCKVDSGKRPAAKPAPAAKKKKEEEEEDDDDEEEEDDDEEEEDDDEDDD